MTFDRHLPPTGNADLPLPPAARRLARRARRGAA